MSFSTKRITQSYCICYFHNYKTQFRLHKLQFTPKPTRKKENPSFLFFFWRGKDMINKPSKLVVIANDRNVQQLNPKSSLYHPPPYFSLITFIIFDSDFFFSQFHQSIIKNKIKQGADWCDKTWRKEHIHDTTRSHQNCYSSN